MGGWHIRLASHPVVAILLVASSYQNQDNQDNLGQVWVHTGVGAGARHVLEPGKSEQPGTPLKNVNPKQKSVTANH